MNQEELRHIRVKYKDRMLALAFIVSGWSPEPEGQRHGCVLALHGKYIVSTGFNGPDRNHRAGPLGGPLFVAPVVHAEVNALLNLKLVGVSARECVAYLTKRPCDPCMRALRKAGVEAVFWLQDTVGPQACCWHRGQKEEYHYHGHADAD